jgi:GT2 family glycosyltransferase
MTKSVILTPCYRYFEPEYLDSCERAEVPVLRLRGTSALHEARDLLLYQAVKAGYDIMLFVDSDIKFARSDVDKVLELCDRSKNIVAGTYVNKTPPHNRVGHLTGEGKLLVGMGFTAIHRTALVRMSKVTQVALLGIAPVMTNCYFIPFIEDGQCLAEDYAFCIRAAKAGVEVVRHPEVVVEHIGSHGFLPA